jgi:hypothetical protein
MTADYHLAKNAPQNAFQLLYERLARIMQQPTSIRDNSFHLLTLLHTFNRYYCYEILPGEPGQAGISVMQPVFLTFASDADMVYPYPHRLLAVDLLKFYLEEDEDDVTFVFYFDNAMDSDVPILMFNWQEFVALYKKYDLYDIPSGKKLPDIFEFQAKESNFKYRNSTGLVMKLGHGIICSSAHQSLPPTYGDLVVIGKGFADTRNLSEFILGKNGVWHVLTEYVAPNRRSTSVNFMKRLRLPSNTGRKLDTVAQQFRDSLFEFLFGADLTYLEENFDGVLYVPTSITPVFTDDVPVRKDSVIETFVADIGFSASNRAQLLDPHLSFDYDEKWKVKRLYINLSNQFHNQQNAIAYIYMALEKSIANASMRVTGSEQTFISVPAPSAERLSWGEIEIGSLEKKLETLEKQVRKANETIDAAIKMIEAIIQRLESVTIK